MTVRATVICDASWCPTSRAGGWAVWINVNYPDGRHERIKDSGNFRTRPRGSEHAEQVACMIGIFLAVQKGAERLLVQNDCLNVVRTRGSTASPRKRAEYLEAEEKYWPHLRGCIEWRHVKGHTAGDDSRTWVNNWCDTEAKRHMRKQRNAT